MLTALCPPIHRENGVSSKKSPGWMEIPKGGLSFMRTKTITFTQGNANQNFCTRASLLKQKAWDSPVLLPNCGSSVFGHKTVVQGGVCFSETQKSNFWVGASYWNWSVLTGWVFLGKLGTVVDRKNCLHFVVARNVPCKAFWASISLGSNCFQTRRRMARERRGAGSSLVSMEMQF